MRTLRLPQPVSAGILLSYQCPCTCKHCMYACSPTWESDWISPQDLDRILDPLSTMIPGNPDAPVLSLNTGLHFTGGEPFLNYPLLLNAIARARDYRIPARFVETNSFWCTDDTTVRRRFSQLRAAGLDGILISVNPFVLEYVPFRHTRRAVTHGHAVFRQGLMIYQSYFYQVFQHLGLHDTLPLTTYLHRDPLGLQRVELLPMGRASYTLGPMFPRYPAHHFFGQACRRELTRNWHIHIDNYGNYIPGYCGGISLGDARHLEALVDTGLDLAQFPLVDALVTDLSHLYWLGIREHGYQERAGGYVSKCHLCVDIRAHIAAQTTQYRELRPPLYYRLLCRDDNELASS